MERDGSELLDTREIAKRLGMERKTAERWLRAGRFPGAIRMGREYRISAADLRKFIESKRLTESQ